MTLGLIVVIVLALAFDFTNGFHDAANSIATVVSTRVLRPQYAVMWAAFFNFAAFLVFGTKVATTIAKDVVDPKAGVLTVGVVFAGLIGAIGWNLITFYLGLPSSSSHALVGGMAGAAVAAAGPHVLVETGPAQDRRVHRPVAADRPGPRSHRHGDDHVGVPPDPGGSSASTRMFRRGQLLSAAAFSLGHGANDAQKTMGVILAVLIAAKRVSPGSGVPLWVVLAAHAAIGLGTLTGGWRIVKTMGSKITRLQPVGGVAAESAAAATLFFTASKGIPVSTTHTITGAIVGVGATPTPLGREMGGRQSSRVGLGADHSRGLCHRGGHRARDQGGRMKDRRALLFLGAAAIALVLIPASDPKLAWVPAVVAVTYVVLAVLSALDALGRRKGR